jgi:hypothetical protein
MISVDVPAELVYRAVNDRVIEARDAGRVLEAFKRALAAPPPMVEDPDERPFVGRNWTQGRRNAFAIAAASSGATAQLPPRPVRPPSGRGVERMPSPRKRMKSGGKR